jgi:hypothetical protein
MTKVDIKRLDSVTKNDTTATEQINDNFKALQEAIENTLSRDGTGPNFMDADLDMNSYRIINSAYPAEDNDIVNLKYVEERIGGAVEASKTAVSAAAQAANSAQSALVSSTNAINTLRSTEEQLVKVVEYVDESIQTIDNTITEAIEDVKKQALDAAQESIDTAAEQATNIATEYANTVIKPQLDEIASNAAESAENAAESAGLAADESDEAKHWAEDSRTWATGEDVEVEEVAPGENEHSSRCYANMAMAIANAPEDVPVDKSKIAAMDIIKGAKGDSSIGAFTGDNTIEGTLNVSDNSNHPLKITGMAGTSATGFQIVDSLGAGDSDFEHYATGDRYGTRITNHNNQSNTSVSVDLYQSNVGKSVLDLSNVETILAPALLGAMYPVGSIYITTNATCPIADLGVGTWELVAEDRVLQGAGTRGAVGTELAESLPNIKGSARFNKVYTYDTGFSGSIYADSEKNGYTQGTEKTSPGYTHLKLDASLSSPTYQDGAPVQPDAYLVNIFRRIQ